MFIISVEWGSDNSWMEAENRSFGFNDLMAGMTGCR